MQRLRIAILLPDLNMGGAQKQALYLTRSLNELSSIEVRVYYSSIEPDRLDIFQQSEVKALSIGQSKNILFRLLKLWQLLNQFKPNLVVSTRTHANLYAGLVAPFVGALSIGTLRNTLSYERGMLGPATRWLCVLPHALAVNSYCARDQVVASGWIARERVHVLLNVIDLKDFDYRAAQPVEAVGSQGVNIFYVGRFVITKRVDRLLSALKSALAQDANVHLVLVGDGDQRPNIEQELMQLGLQDHVTLLGERNNVPALLKQRAHILALASDEEGFPNVVIEAMAAGIPVITTPAGDSGIIVEDGVTGYVVDYKDTDRMAERIVSLANNEAERQRLGANGRKQVEAKYSYETLAFQALSVFQQVAGSTRTGDVVKSALDTICP